MKKYYIAKDKDGTVHLFWQKPYRDGDRWWIDVPDSIKEWTKGMDDYNSVIGYWMELEANDYPTLRWEDEPQECVVTELHPTYVVNCEHCGKEIRYKRSDIKESFCYQPSSGYEETFEYVICTHCGKSHFLNTF